MVSVGTIVWLSSELMFFAALFAMYFSIRATAVGQAEWAEHTKVLNLPVRADLHDDPGALVDHLPARRVPGRAG